MGSYYNAAQLRTDLWHRLRTLTDRLSADNASDRGRLREEIAGVLDRLEPIELYWARAL